MGSADKSDFASMLDDLFVAAEPPADPALRPSVPFDYLSVAEELHSGRITLSGEAVTAEYRETGPDFEADLRALLEEAEIVPQDPEPLPPLEPEAIAIELGLADALPEDLGRLRRNFAMRNHPDRVPPHLRRRALIRMQLANRLIDDARERAPARGKR